MLNCPPSNLGFNFGSTCTPTTSQHSTVASCLIHLICNALRLIMYCRKKSQCTPHLLSIRLIMNPSQFLTQGDGFTISLMESRCGVHWLFFLQYIISLTALHKVNKTRGYNMWSKIIQKSRLFSAIGHLNMCR